MNIETISVVGGTFKMGSETGHPDECPVHEVTLSDFEIGKYPVTQAQWVEIMGSNPSHFKGDDLPVESVSWEDVQLFIEKLNEKTGLNYRLPSEAEWEYAARGGQLSNGFKYAGSDNLNDVAWYRGNSGSKTHPVGLKASNELGIYDMSGNIYEWCADWYDSYTSDSQTNPIGPLTGDCRVVRVGSWYYYVDNCQVSFLSFWIPYDWYLRTGFRLLRPL